MSSRTEFIGPTLELINNNNNLRSDFLLKPQTYSKLILW